jgi:hypothetical protein
MAQIISTLDDAIEYLNTLYNFSSTPPTDEEEEYAVWTSLFNVAINLWEREALWEELIVWLADASDGDKLTVADTFEYDCPTDFRFHVGGWVWLGDNTNKEAYQVIKAKEVHLHHNDTERWCYFLNGILYFNPNLTFNGGETINYEYYKKASAVSGGTDVFEMSDPMFAVYFALSELKKDEGDSTAAQIATQKLNKMVDENDASGWFQPDNLMNKTEEGFGV